jgi:hypothetical protein
VPPGQKAAARLAAACAAPRPASFPGRPDGNAKRNDRVDCPAARQRRDDDQGEQDARSLGGAHQVLGAFPARGSHHDDGTPGTAMLVVVHNLDALHAELHKRGYPFFNPGISPGPGSGRQMQLMDPASNRIRFYEPVPAS